MQQGIAGQGAPERSASASGQEGMDGWGQLLQELKWIRGVLRLCIPLPSANTCESH